MALENGVMSILADDSLFQELRGPTTWPQKDGPFHIQLTKTLDAQLVVLTMALLEYKTSGTRGTPCT